MTMINRLLAIAGPERAVIRRALAYRLVESFCASLPYGVMLLGLIVVLSPESIKAQVPDALVGPWSPLWFTVILLVAYGAQAVVANRAAELGYGTGYKLTARLRAALADHLARLPMSYFRTRDSGQLTQVLMQDVTAIEQVPGLVVPRFVAAVVLPVIGLLAALAVAPAVGGALVATVLIAVVTLVIGQRRLRGASQDRGNAMAVLNARLLEFVHGIQVVKAFGLTADRLRRLDAALSAARDTSKAITLRFVVPAIAVPVSLALGAAVVLVLIASGLGTGTLDLAIAVFLLLIAVRLFAPIGELVDFWAMIRLMEAALDRVGEVTAAAPLPEGRIRTPPPDTTIRFEAVSLDYGGGTSSLSALSFTAEAGRMTAIVGPTGAGKTSVARLIGRHWDPTEGRVTIGGVDLRDLDAATLADLVGHVSQDVVHFSMSVRDNIRLGRPDASDAEVVAAAEAARCDGFVRRLDKGYDTVLTGGAAALSGGERQRLALARLFLKDAPIVILDEATSALDVENERLLQEALDRLVVGRTVIVIAHRLWTVRAAHRIVVLDRGALVEQGCHDELRQRRGLYDRLWRSLTEAPGWRRIDGAAPRLELSGGPA